MATRCIGGGVDRSGAKVKAGTWVCSRPRLLGAGASGHQKGPRLVKDDPWSHAPIWVKLVRVHEERAPLFAMQSGATLPCSHAAMHVHASVGCSLSGLSVCTLYPVLAAPTSGRDNTIYLLTTVHTCFG